MGVYRKVHQIIKYLKLKRMNPNIEHREQMLA